jgi:hypothetical protein
MAISVAVRGLRWSMPVCSNPVVPGQATLYFAASSAKLGERAHN